MELTGQTERVRAAVATRVPVGRVGANRLAIPVPAVPAAACATAAVELLTKEAVPWNVRATTAVATVAPVPVAAIPITIATAAVRAAAAAVSAVEAAVHALLTAVAAVVVRPLARPVEAVALAEDKQTWMINLKQEQ